MEILRQMEKMKVEHDNWRSICVLLEKTGAVTDYDLRSKATEQDTDGQKLLEAIRIWGNSLVELRLGEKENQT